MFEIHVHHYFGDCNALLDRIERLIRPILRGEGEIMANLDDIKAAVAAERDAVTSIATLVQKLADDIAAEIAAGADPQKMQDLVDEIKSQADSLAQAAVVGTSADQSANPPVPTPSPVPDTNTPANPNTAAAAATASGAPIVPPEEEHHD
jgi:ATP/maltotriose-dependent transcriptional regulator MalT